MAHEQGRTRRLGSSLRVRSAKATLAIARDVGPRLGISRVTDVTRMDRLGLPVYVSVRPRGRTLCVHAGKGIDPVDAEVGAWMEAVEYAAAEPQRTPWTLVQRRLDELDELWAGAFDLLDLTPHVERSFDGGTLFDTVLCEDLAGGRSVPLPCPSIFVPYEYAEPSDLLMWSTNGLASGNSVEEATLHALLEVLERDAEAMNVGKSESLWVDPAELPPPFAQRTEQWRAIGVDLAVRQQPSAFGLPCFEALLSEPASDLIRLTTGFGMHLDRDIALARAVTEAAQSRLSLIHGGRDDVVDFYERAARLGVEGARQRDREAAAAKFDRTRRIRYDATPHFDCDGLDLGDVLATLLRHLRELGFGQVLRYRFDIDLQGLHVVKVVVPRCENWGPPFAHLGRRLRQRVAET